MDKTDAILKFYSSDVPRIREMIADSVEFTETTSGLSIAVPADQSIQEAFQSLSLQLPQPAIALVNGRTNDFGYVLQPGDEVLILFQISGG